MPHQVVGDTGDGRDRGRWCPVRRDGQGTGPQQHARIMSYQKGTDQTLFKRSPSPVWLNTLVSSKCGAVGACWPRRPFRVMVQQ